jgi:CTP:molybdopterin cytidylyltransferase MocA
MIAGIVLAGGESLRMGRPKALLAIGAETFLERAIRTLRAGGCQDIVVVLGGEDREIAGLAARTGARGAPGPGPGSEQIDSLRAGLRGLPLAAEAAVVLPVDHPLVRPTTVAALVAAFRSGGAPVVRPAMRGRHGHPVLFAAAVFDELLHGELAEGARSVIRKHAPQVLDVEVDDPGVLADVDTPDDYERHLGGPR